MFGVNIGTLSVHIRDTINGPLDQLWIKSGELGDYYERADIKLSRNKPFQVNDIVITVIRLIDLHYQNA